MNSKGKSNSAILSEIDGVEMSNRWEKSTFAGDSGAVTHVITPKTAEAFRVEESEMLGIKFQGCEWDWN